MADVWTFRSYVSADGEKEVESWYAAQSLKVQATFDRRIATLRQMEPNEWREPYVKQLDGECDGLVEIRFKTANVQHRPLGFYGPGRMEFTILFFAIEKGDQFKPKDACRIALRRKEYVLANPGASTVFETE